MDDLATSCDSLEEAQTLDQLDWMEHHSTEVCVPNHVHGLLSSPLGTRPGNVEGRRAASPSAFYGPAGPAVWRTTSRACDAPSERWRNSS
ncbi:hypothetical protein T05_1485 [Trichinella murrelli]|uniref:Uncharacterized protein n=1 Tax=Trichinella murrelli TaxID=144512 RepID=A0A0V0TFH9_9BILA|nr:hypothetical protein T05_1485 [Trichinella murrelli]